MTGRDKMLAAFSAGGSPEIPAVICYHGICLRDHWSQVTDLPWWAIHQPDPRTVFAIHRDFISKTGEDWFRIRAGCSHRERETLRIEERADGVFRVNTQTAETTKLVEPIIGGWPRDGGLMHIEPEEPILTAADVERLVPVADEEPDCAEQLAPGRLDLTHMLLDAFGHEKMPMGHVSSPLWSCYGIWGFEGMMLALADTPELTELACQRLTTNVCCSVRYLAAIGAEAVWIEECLTDMISPELFRRFNVPCLRRITDAIRDCGMKSVHYYCGDPAGKWDLLLESGADALSLEESKKGFDINVENVVERVGGRMTVFGNLDAICLLEHGSEAALRAEIARQIAAGRRNGSRFVMSIGSPVTPGTTIERVRLYTDIARELGRDQC